VLLGPVEPDPAVTPEDLLPLDTQVPRRVVRRPAPAADLGELAHEVLGQPRPDLVAERRLGRRVEEVHQLPGSVAGLLRTVRTVLDRSVKLPPAGTLHSVNRPAHFETPELRIDKLTVGPFENNVFVLRSKGTGEATLLDAANEHDLLLEVSRETGVR